MVETAFQADGFQDDAFQIAADGGWLVLETARPSRRRRRERVLARAATFHQLAVGFSVLDVRFAVALRVLPPATTVRPPLPVEAGISDEDLALLLLGVD